MKNLLVVVLVVLVLLAIVPRAAEASFYCKYARYHPGFAVICFWEVMMETWSIDDYFADQPGALG